MTSENSLFYQMMQYVLQVRERLWIQLWLQKCWTTVLCAGHVMEGATIAMIKRSSGITGHQLDQQSWRKYWKYHWQWTVGSTQGVYQRWVRKWLMNMNTSIQCQGFFIIITQCKNIQQHYLNLKFLGVNE